MTEDYPYDLECLPNFFSAIFHRVSDNARWRFVIAPWRDQSKELNHFLWSVTHSQGRGVGYNNEKYDYPMLHFIMEHNGMVDNAMLYAKSQAIINADFNDRSHVIWDDQRLFRQCDLLRVHHFDNKAKLTSLKLLEFNMRMDSIEELELDFNKPILPEQEEIVLTYNDHDVDATLQFYHESKEQLQFRQQLTEKYGKDFSNHNDTRIGQDIVLYNLAQKGIKANKFTQTHRASITVRDIILPYIRFERPEFNEVLRFFQSAIIDPEKIKGFFGSRDRSKSKCNAPISAALAAFMEPDDVTVLYSDKTRSTLSQLDPEKQVLSMIPCNVHCIINGFRFDFGAGGIHGSVTNSIIIPGEDEELEDSDVASYYPNLGIKNRLYPLHLGEGFCDTMDEMFHARLKDKKSVMGNAYKLGMNGSYGKSNDKHSPFYDPQYTMAITINGQLSLCMLAEQLLKVPNLRLVQVNTDGLTYIYPKQYYGHIRAITRWWEEVTQLELESVSYSKMCIRDVNSYIAIKKPYEKDGKIIKPEIKRIGAYAYERAQENPKTRELPWHKNYSAIVVAKAAEAALVLSTPIEHFIRNHLSVDQHDFMLRTKVNRSDKLVLVDGDTEKPMQRVTRYFVSNSGGQLIKVMEPTDKQIEDWKTTPHWKHKKTGIVKKSKKQPSGMYEQCPPPTELPPDRRIGIDAGFNVTVCNRLAGLDMSDININYYVDAARKLVDPLLKGSVYDMADYTEEDDEE